MSGCAHCVLHMPFRVMHALIDSTAVQPKGVHALGGDFLSRCTGAVNCHNRCTLQPTPRCGTTSDNHMSSLTRRTTHSSALCIHDMQRHWTSALQSVRFTSIQQLQVGAAEHNKPARRYQLRNRQAFSIQDNCCMEPTERPPCECFATTRVPETVTNSRVCCCRALQVC
jgi:hypothetical protein